MLDSEANKILYREYSDKIFDKRYNSPNPLRRYVHRAQYQSILNHVLPGEKVLDAGCGEGVLSCLLAREKDVQITGIDISEPNIVRAKELAREMGVVERVTFFCGDAEALPVPDSSFDTVISCHVLEHLPNFNKGLSEIYRVSRRKAIVALPTILNLCSLVQVGHGSFWELSKRSLVALPWGFFRLIFNLFGEGVDEGYGGHRELVHIFRFPWVVRKILLRGGFEILHHEASTLAIPYFPSLVPFIKRADRLKTSPIFRNFGYGSTLVLLKADRKSG